MHHTSLGWGGVPGGGPAGAGAAWGQGGALLEQWRSLRQTACTLKFYSASVDCKAPCHGTCTCLRHAAPPLTLHPFLPSHPGASGPPLPCSSFGDISKRLLRMACLLTPPGSAQRAALLRSMAAAAVAASIKEVLAYLGARQQGLGDYRVGSPWSLWLYGPGLELWQVDVLAEGVEQLLRSCRSGSGRSTAEAEAKARVLEQ